MDNFAQMKHAATNRMNAYGEAPINDAPEVMVQSATVIPQQFLLFHRDAKTIEAVLDDIAFNEKYVLFVNPLADLFYIQVGIIGRENYPPSQEARAPKIVYGRKWLIDADMPTSEIIQTAFLAIKKTREHEIREYFVLELMDEKGDYLGKCTPFNSHIDLPLLADSRNTVEQCTAPWSLHNAEQNIKALLNHVSLAAYRFELVAIEQRTMHISRAESANESNIAVPEWYIDLRMVDAASEFTAHRDSAEAINTYFPELKNAVLRLALPRLDASAMLFALMDSLLKLSDDYVAETFTFRGFARFSTRNNAQAIGAFSRQSRIISPDQCSESFKQTFAVMTQAVDSQRAPAFNRHALGDRQRNQLGQYQRLEGYLPLKAAQGRVAADELLLNKRQSQASSSEVSFAAGFSQIEGQSASEISKHTTQNTRNAAGDDSSNI